MSYRVAHEPGPLCRIAHQKHTRSVKLLCHCHVTLHIHESNGQQRAVLLQASYHALLTLCHQQETLATNISNGCDRASDFFSGDELQLAVGFWATGLGNDVDDLKDVDTTPRRQVFTTNEAGTNGDQLLPFVRVLRYLEIQYFYGEDNFESLELLSVGETSSSCSSR